MVWKTPPNIKVYEALGSIADNRIEIKNNCAKVFSSSGNKFYDVEFDEKNNAIMCNDNGSYWIGYLGYPAIAYLMKIGKIRFNENYANSLKDIMWKDVNQKFKNNFDKTCEYVRNIMIERGVDLEEFDLYLDDVIMSIKNMKLEFLGKKKMPPKGY